MNLLETLLKFFNIPNVGDTPQNKGQCVGLVESYADTLSLPHIWGDAKDLLTNADPTAFAITHNDPNDINQFPQAGSIMVWGDTWGNGDGHTGVVIFADGKLFATLEQNNPQGHAPQTIMHDYKGVLGWLTPKNLPSVPTTEELMACMKDRNDFWVQRDAAITAANDKQKELDEANGKLTSFAAMGYATIDDINKRLDEDTKTIQGLQTEVKQVLDRNGQLAAMVAAKEKEDSTAIDSGRDAQLKVVELERQLQMVAKEMQTEPVAKAILSKFDSLQKLASWGEKFLKSKEVAKVEKKVTVETNKSTIIMDIYEWFGLKGGV